MGLLREVVEGPIDLHDSSLRLQCLINCKIGTFILRAGEKCRLTPAGCLSTLLRSEFDLPNA